MSNLQKGNVVMVLESTKSILEKIEKSKLNAVVTRCDSLAFELADGIDKGDRGGKLAGLPILIKDNLLLKGHRIFCCSKAWDGVFDDKNAVVVDRLIDEGAVIAGIANMDEFAMGATNLTSCFGGVTHPIDDNRVVGGSSGGSAAAVAAGLCFAALGTDTGGSIRQPSSYCGVAGLKPSFGAVDMDGVIPLVPMWDVVGPIARTVADCELMFESMVQREITFVKKEKYKIGFVREFFEFMSREDKGAFKEAKDKLEGLGHEIIEVRIPSVKMAGEIYEVIGCSESYKSLIKTGVDIEKLGVEARGRADKGRRYLEDKKLLDNMRKKGEQLKIEVDAAFDLCDIILSPTVPSIAFKKDSLNSFEAINSDFYLRPFNISGHPALSIPIYESDGLPIGIQIVGRMDDEGLLFEIGKMIEK
ncbi:MAG: amidase [Firmicutes bacterium]|nr:amidase [Bacillota bacterium]